MDISLEGWDIEAAHAAEWMPWGTKGNARAKILGSADGYMVTYVEADPGYEGDPHVHGHPEFFYLVDGTITNWVVTWDIDHGDPQEQRPCHGDNPPSGTSPTFATYEPASTAGSR
jgi:hypothetical protein